jgi:hypothetical protein
MLDQIRAGDTIVVCCFRHAARSNPGSDAVPAGRPPRCYRLCSGRIKALARYAAAAWASGPVSQRKERFPAGVFWLEARCKELQPGEPLQIYVWNRWTPRSPGSCARALRRLLSIAGKS